MDAETIDETVKGYYDVRNEDVVGSMTSLNFYNDGICDQGIHSIVGGHEVRGRALTVRLLPTNRQKPNFDIDSEKGLKPVDLWNEDYGRVFHDFLDITEPGDIICIDMGGADYMFGGDHISLKLMLRGAFGMVIDGGIRNVHGLQQINFPVWSRYVAQKEYAHMLELDAINEPIDIGGVNVESGDLICCGADGVVVVPQRYEEEVLTTATDYLETDEDLREGKVDLLNREGVDIDVDFTAPSKRQDLHTNIQGVSDEVWEEVLEIQQEDY
jgi:regulator of RNase E activity RraA